MNNVTMRCIVGMGMLPTMSSTMNRSELTHTEPVRLPIRTSNERSSTESLDTFINDLKKKISEQEVTIIVSSPKKTRRASSSTQSKHKHRHEHATSTSLSNSMSSESLTRIHRSRSMQLPTTTKESESTDSRIHYKRHNKRHGHHTHDQNTHSATPADEAANAINCQLKRQIKKLQSVSSIARTKLDLICARHEAVCNSWQQEIEAAHYPNLDSKNSLQALIQVQEKTLSQQKQINENLCAIITLLKNTHTNASTPRSSQ